MNRRGEQIFVAVLLLCSTAALFLAYQIAGFSKLASPGVFPMLASGTMVLSAIFIFLGNRHTSGNPERSTARKVDSALKLGPTAQPDLTTASVFNKALYSQPAIPVRVAIITAFLAVYIITMPALGFLLSSGLFLFISIGYLWSKPLWLCFVVSFVSLLVIHVVFRQVFQVILPQGLLINLIS